MKFLIVIFSLVSLNSFYSQEETVTMKQDEVNTDSIYDIVGKMPEFPGGIEKLYQFLAENLRFPEMSLDSQIQGKVYVTFVVDDSGKIFHQKIIKGLDPLIENEIIRVLKLMPEWIPGEQNGKCVSVRYTLPIQIHWD